MYGNTIRRTLIPLWYLALCFVLAGSAFATAEKPYKPSWKYHTHRIRVDVQADGTTTTHFEYALVALEESAKEFVADREISYHENNGSLEDVDAYTLKADGTKLPLPETNVQVTSHNGVNGAPPAFSDLKNRNLIFPNVEVGDTVVLAYTLRDEKPTFKRYFSLLTHYSEHIGYDDAQLVITAPRNFGLRYKSYHIAEPTIGALDGNRQSWKWTYRNTDPKDTRKESSQFERAWHDADRITVEISNFRDYRDIAEAYEVEAARRATVTDRIKALAAEITRDVNTPRERAEKIYKWTAKEINFAGNCLTGGDVVPRDTDLILNMKMGDCKDHATLMQALLAAQGIDSTQVLINAGEQGYELPGIPCWQAFNHVINYVPAFGVYLDATSTSSPFGVLPPSEYGKAVIRTSAYAGVERIPMRGSDSDWSQSTDHLTILADGSIDAIASYRLGGSAANAFSHRFSEWKKSANFDGGADQIKRVIEGRGFKGGGGYDDIANDTAAPNTFGYGMHYHVDGYLDTDSPYGLTLAPFFPGPSSLAGMISYAAAEPYDHDFLCHGDRRTEELSVTFPSSVQLLAIPKTTHVETNLLQFDARYEQDGNTIRVTRTIVDKSPGPICPADVSRQYAQIGAAIKKDLRAQAVYQPK